MTAEAYTFDPSANISTNNCRNAAGGSSEFLVLIIERIKEGLIS